MGFRLHMGHFLGRFGGDNGIILPARISENEVSFGKSLCLAFKNFRKSPASHNLSALNSIAVGCTLHPGAIGRVERNVSGAQKQLTFVGKCGNRCFRQFEMFGPQLAFGRFNQLNLPINRLAHAVFPP